MEILLFIFIECQTLDVVHFQVHLQHNNLGMLDIFDGVYALLLLSLLLLGLNLKALILLSFTKARRIVFGSARDDYLIRKTLNKFMFVAVGWKVRSYLLLYICDETTSIWPHGVCFYYISSLILSHSECLKSFFCSLPFFLGAYAKGKNPSNPLRPSFYVQKSLF